MNFTPRPAKKVVMAINSTTGSEVKRQVCVWFRLALTVVQRIMEVRKPTVGVCWKCDTGCRSKPLLRSRGKARTACSVCRDKGLRATSLVVIGHALGRCYLPRKPHNPGRLFLCILVWSYCFIARQRACAMQESLNLQQNGTGRLVQTNETN
jgi:hypothetical protein